MTAKILSLALLVGLVTSSRATPTGVYWNFSTGTGAPLSLSANVTAPVNLFANNEQPGNNPLFDMVSSSGGYSGLQGPASSFHNASVAVVNGALDPLTSTYFEFTIAPDAGYSLLATNFQVGTWSNLKGPQTLTLLASTDSFATSSVLGSATGLPTSSTWNLVTLSSFTYSAAVDVPITFRLYGSGGIGGAMASNWRIDDVTLGVVAVPEPSTYATLFLGVVLLGTRALRRRKIAVA